MPRKGIIYFGVVCLVLVLLLGLVLLIEKGSTVRKDDFFQNETSSSQNTTSADSSEIVGIPSCAQGNTSCEHLDQYSDKRVHQVLSTTDSNMTADKVGLQEVSKANRDEDQEERPVCQSNLVTIYPKVAKNTAGQWKYIVNIMKDNHTQGVQVETCSHKENAPCDVIGKFLNGYVTSCKNKYHFTRLLSLDDDGQIAWDYFMFPSGCFCSFRRHPLLTSLRTSLKSEESDE